MFKNLYKEINHESLEGKILVASPHLEDHYFSRSLIYICAHDTSGAIGIMINQKIGMISYGEFMPLGDQSKISAAIRNKKFPLISGGPVNDQILIALSLSNKGKINNLNASDITVNTDVAKFFKDLIKHKKSPKKFILVKGVSAWESQQLEEEIVDENAWFVIPASADIIFSQKTRDKWSYTIKKLGITNIHEFVKYCGSG
jgi:putative transcriptional regulator